MSTSAHSCVLRVVLRAFHMVYDDMLWTEEYMNNWMTRYIGFECRRDGLRCGLYVMAAIISVSMDTSQLSLGS